MLRNTLAASSGIKFLIQQQFIRHLSQSTPVSATKWDLYAGIQLERLPVITKTLTKLERDYKVCTN